MSKRKAIVACLMAGSTVVIGGSFGPATPAGADNVVGNAWVAGNFVGDARDEVFDYVAGAEPEYLVSFDVDVNGNLVATESQFAVGGNYLPVAGDFDGDNRDEIFWYGPGTTPDSMWHFQSTTSAASVPYSVSGNYKPQVGDFTGDGVDDIYWYAPGPGGDPLWDFNGSGAYTSSSRPANGTYTPVVVSVGTDDTDDIFWYGPGGTPDSVWNFIQGSTNYRSSALPVNGVYQPISLDAWGDGVFGGDILWYTAGAAQNPFWDFFDGTRRNDLEGSPGEGDHDFLVGDYFGDSSEDILWVSDTHTALWDYFTFVDDQGFLNLTRATFDSAVPSGADARVGAGEGTVSHVGSELNGTTATEGDTVTRR